MINRTGVEFSLCYVKLVPSSTDGHTRIEPAVRLFFEFDSFCYDSQVFKLILAA